MTTNTNEKAAQNELRTLEAIARFGVLMSRDVAAIAFKNAGSDASGLNMANRTLARLMALKQVGRKQSRLGLWYYLQESGARRCNDDLNENGVGAFARYGGHLSVMSTIDRKRCISEVARNLSKNDFEVMGQFALFLVDDELKDFDLFAVKKRKNGCYTMGVRIALNVRDTGKFLAECSTLVEHCNKILIHGETNTCLRLLHEANKIENLNNKLILLREDNRT